MTLNTITTAAAFALGVITALVSVVVLAIAESGDIER